jgi:hypothetical protein
MTSLPKVKSRGRLFDPPSAHGEVKQQQDSACSNDQASAPGRHVQMAH